MLLLSLMLVFVGASLLVQQPAYAYADPGTGLLAIQALGSALIATGWYLRRKINTMFHSNPAVKSDLDSYSSSTEQKGTIQ